MHSIENVREYLEEELGDKLLMRLYPRLLDIGDDIFADENLELLQQALQGLLTDEQISKYIQFFATLVFYEKQTEEFGGGEAAHIDANKSLRNLSQMTAAFGGGFMK
jgi:hypothetical protein